MKLGTRPISGTASGADHLQAGFTLAEVLAALLFMAIVIPVAMQGLHIASRAGVVAARKAEALEVAERVLSECVALTNWNQSSQSGTLVEGDRQYRWTLQSQAWDQDLNEPTINLLSVEVTYPVQGQDYFVRLSTLVDSSAGTITATNTTSTSAQTQ